MRRVGYRRILANAVAAAALLTGCAAQKPAARAPVVLVEPIEPLPVCLEVVYSDGDTVIGKIEMQKQEAVVSAGEMVYAIGKIGTRCAHSNRKEVKVSRIDDSGVDFEVEIRTHDAKRAGDGGVKCPSEVQISKFRINFDGTKSGDLSFIAEREWKYIQMEKAGEDKVHITFSIPKHGPCMLD